VFVFLRTMLPFPSSDADNDGYERPVLVLDVASDKTRGQPPATQKRASLISAAQSLNAYDFIDDCNRGGRAELNSEFLEGNAHVHSKGCIQSLTSYEAHVYADWRSADAPQHADDRAIQDESSF
jgi:hypothetical protein